MSKRKEPKEPSQIYLEVRGVDGKWTRLSAFNEDDPAALRALMKARYTDATAGLRITDAQANIMIDIPPAALDASAE
jgi:hypothetical protein